MSFSYKYPITSGYGTVNNTTPSISLLAAPGAGKLLRICAGIVIVQVAAVGGSGIVTLQDGSTDILEWDANSVNSFPINLTEIGLALGTNNALTLLVGEAVTTQATVYAAFTAYIVQ